METAKESLSMNSPEMCLDLTVRENTELEGTLMEIIIVFLYF